jgi:hypothetical protein
MGKRDIFMAKRKGNTFYGGHDPEDFQHQVWEAPTVDLHPNSPGYRLILNNVLFLLPERKNKRPNFDSF